MSLWHWHFWQPRNVYTTSTTYGSEWFEELFYDVTFRCMGCGQTKVVTKTRPALEKIRDGLERVWKLEEENRRLRDELHGRRNEVRSLASV